MPAFAQILIVFAAAASLMACERRDFFEELAPESVDALNGIYREKSATAEASPIEGLEADPSAHSDLVIEGGLVAFRRLSALNEVEAVLVANLSPGQGASFEMSPHAGLAEASKTEKRLSGLQGLFADGAKIRVLRAGTQLKVTEIRGSYRRTTSWEKISNLGDPESAANSAFKSAQEKSRKLKTQVDALLKHWGERTLDLFEKVENRANPKGGPDNVLVTSGAKIEDEVAIPLENGAPGKLSLRMKRIKLTSASSALINDKHAGELIFRLRKKPDGTEGLYMILLSNADARTYLATELQGFVEIEGEGLRITYFPGEGASYKTMASRYYPLGQTGLTPTEPVGEAEDEGKTPEPEAPAPPSEPQAVEVSPLA